MTSTGTEKTTLRWFTSGVGMFILGEALFPRREDLVWRTRLFLYPQEVPQWLELRSLACSPWPSP
jgi:hypothetical protein